MRHISLILTSYTRRAVSPQEFESCLSGMPRVGLAQPDHGGGDTVTGTVAQEDPYALSWDKRDVGLRPHAVQ